MYDLPRLQTARLTLRVPLVSDAAGMARFAAENREHFEAWESTRPVDYFTGGYWQVRLARELEAIRAGLGLSMVLLRRDDPDARIAGQCTLSQIVRGPLQAAYLGYGIDRHSEGEGLMSEALRTLIAHAFGSMNLHRIMAGYIPENERSGRMLELLGFEHEGRARDYLRISGRWRDHVLTALVNPDWSENGPGAR